MTPRTRTRRQFVGDCCVYGEDSAVETRSYRGVLEICFLSGGGRNGSPGVSPVRLVLGVGAETKRKVETRVGSFATFSVFAVFFPFSVFTTFSRFLFSRLLPSRFLFLRYIIFFFLCLFHAFAFRVCCRIRLNDLFLPLYDDSDNGNITIVITILKRSLVISIIILHYHHLHRLCIRLLIYYF